MTALIHGDVRQYWRGCRCVACRSAASAYEQRRRGRQTGYVAATVARDHLRRLRDRGMGTPRLAALSGVARNRIQEILGGRCTRIRRATERRILTVQQPSKAPGALVKSWRSRRIRQALKAEGWTKKDIQRHLRGHDQGFDVNRPRVRQSTERDLERLYRHWMHEELDSTDEVPV